MKAINSAANRYTLYGVLFGLFFPLFSIILMMLIKKNSFSINTIIQLHNTIPLLLVIDTAPIFLGLFARIAGVRQDKINNALSELKLLNEQREDAYKKISLSEKRYRFLVEESEDLIFELDEKWNFTSANNTIKKWLKIEPGKILHTNFMDIIYDDQVSKELTHQHLLSIIDSKETITFKTNLSSPLLSEPIGIQVKLKNNHKNQIVGRASKITDDKLLKYFTFERQKLNIENYLTLAEEVTHRLTRNLHRFLPHNEVASIRIAVREIVINGIEHGNLGINFEEKTEALLSDTYFDLLAEKRARPENKQKRVNIDFIISSKKILYKITDQGDGFDYKKILSEDPNATNHAMLPHGRGLTIAKEVFDNIVFNKKGNSILLIKNLSQKID